MPPPMLPLLHLSSFAVNSVDFLVVCLLSLANEDVATASLLSGSFLHRLAIAASLLSGSFLRRLAIAAIPKIQCCHCRSPPSSSPPPSSRHFLPSTSSPSPTRMSPPPLFSLVISFVSSPSPPLFSLILSFVSSPLPLLSSKSILGPECGRSLNWAPSEADLQGSPHAKALGVALCGRPSDAQVSGGINEQQMRGEGSCSGNPPIRSSKKGSNGGRVSRPGRKREDELVVRSVRLPGQFLLRGYL